VNLDNLHGSNPANLQGVENSLQYRFVKGDINDRDMVNETIVDADAVVSFAAQTRVDLSWRLQLYVNGK